jgi:hypothetical protein
MASTILKVVLTFYILNALLKFLSFFFRAQTTKLQGLQMAYASEARVISIFDNVALTLAGAMGVLQFLSGIDYLSFTTGLLVGMTLIQVFFHRFRDPLPADKTPEPPLTALKLMSYSIQIMPQKDWREFLMMSRSVPVGALHACNARFRYRCVSVM